MKTRFQLITAIVLMTAGIGGHAALPGEDGQPLPSLAPVVKRVAPAVVNIRVSQTVAARSPYADEMFRRFFGLPDMDPGSREVQSAGSGVIVDADEGYILTNHHVVSGGNEVTVREILDLGAEQLADRDEVNPAFTGSIHLALGSAYNALGLGEQALPLLDQADAKGDGRRGGPNDISARVGGQRMVGPV